jgi:hypothetical protein
MRNVDEAADEIGDRKFDALPERVQEAFGERARRTLIDTSAQQARAVHAARQDRAAGEPRQSIPADQAVCSSNQTRVVPSCTPSDWRAR